MGGNIILKFNRTVRQILKFKLTHSCICIEMCVQNIEVLKCRIVAMYDMYNFDERDFKLTLRI